MKTLHYHMAVTMDTAIEPGGYSVTILVPRDGNEERLLRQAVVEGSVDRYVFERSKKLVRYTFTTWVERKRRTKDGSTYSAFIVPISTAAVIYRRFGSVSTYVLVKLEKASRPIRGEEGLEELGIEEK